MPGQDGRVGPAGVSVIAVLLAAVLLSAVGFAALRSDTASADTVLGRGADAVLVLADGTTRAAVEGETVPRGATVQAGRTGAELVTRERVVHLGGETDVTVLDGARQELHRGFVMVEAADAPGLDVRTAAATVSAPDDALVRIDIGPLTRIGVLRGDPARVRPASRSVTTLVDTYFQVQVPAGGLPSAATPYVLTEDDEYEMRLAGDLVRADADLTALASRLDAQGVAGSVVLSALRRDVPDLPALAAGAPGSEAALGYLIATAVPGERELVEDYARVRDLRDDGGSWGIVAAIVEAPVDGVAAALNALLDPQTVPVVAGGPLDVSDLVGALTGQQPSGGGQDPQNPQAPSAPRPPQTEPNRPDDPQRPSPSPSPGVLDPVTTVVDEVVETVLELVSTPSPTPSGSPPAPLLELELELPPLLK
jgi:hypothetical protein